MNNYKKAVATMPTTSVKQRESLKRIAWFMWGLTVLFYCYEFFVKISFSVIGPDYAREHILSAATIGTLSAYFYYAYAFMQIPAGVLVDRHGVRHLLTLAALTVSLGCLLFGVANDLWVAKFARVLLGIGSAFAFVGCLKVGASWFASRQFSLVIGLTNMLGVIGAISAGAPLALLIERTGWRHTMLYAALLGAVIALCISLFLRNSPSHFLCRKQKKSMDCAVSQEDHLHLFAGLKHIARSQQTWLLASYAGLVVAPVAAFGELWIVPFLMQALHCGKPMASLLLSMVFIGIAIGGPLHGLIAQKFERRKPIMITGALGALVSLSIILYWPIHSAFVMGAWLCGYGFCSSTMLLGFALAAHINPKEYSGVVIGFTNMMVMAMGAFFQQAIGWLLDTHTQYTKIASLQLFTLQDYRVAFYILPVCLLIALLILSWIHDHNLVSERGTQ